MKEPKVIHPEGFSVEQAWRECHDWVDRHGECSIAAAFGADPGCCSCPVCHESYWSFGAVIECECGFVFPTNWWHSYSSGVNDGRRIKAGGKPDAFIKLQCRNPFYRHGFENPTEDAFSAKDTIDWKTFCEGTPIENYLPIDKLGLCGRCGLEKEQGRRNSPTKLCIKCTTETECKFRCSMMERCCEAGVVFDELRARKPSNVGYSLPCYYVGGTTRIECEKFEPVTEQDCIDHDDKIAAAIARFTAVGPIVSRIKEEHKKRDWSGVEDGPICKGKLHLSHSGYNGHVHGKCETEDCLAWME